MVFFFSQIGLILFLISLIGVSDGFDYLEGNYAHHYTINTDEFDYLSTDSFALFMKQM